MGQEGSKKDFNSQSNKRSKLGNEPEWDLSDFYASPTDPQIETDLASLKQESQDFAARYKGKVAGLDAKSLLQAVERMDKQSSLYAKLGSYAGMLAAKDLQKYGAFDQKIGARFTEISTSTTFFGLELAQLPPQQVQDMLDAEPGLEKYRVYLEQSVAFQPYCLGEEAENTWTRLDQIGASAWSRFFDELDTRTKFDWEGQKVGIEKINTIRSSNPDRDVRQRANEALYKGLKETMWQRVYIMNMVSLDNALTDDLRGMPHALASSNMSKNIADNVMEAMNKAINAAYPRISHRFYELKRQVLGINKLKAYDRNASIRLAKGKEEEVSFDEGKKIVLDSYRSISDEMADIVQMFFDKGWIDAKVTDGKTSGAFSAMTSVDMHPLNLLNWTGSSRDVATMAHELGHGVHQYLAAQHTKSQIAASTPLTLAEVASIFGEKVTFERILSQETDPARRIELLAGKVDDMINTVVRQNAFYNFEQKIHATRKASGENLKAEDLEKIYMDTQTEALGPAFDLDPDYGVEWSYIPHFIHTPYYVPSYAFADCVVNVIYAKYEQTPDADKPQFVENYLNLLRAGGTEPTADALQNHLGIDISDPAVWDEGMKPIESLINRLETEIAAFNNQPAPGNDNKDPSSPAP